MITGGPRQPERDPNFGRPSPDTVRFRRTTKTGRRFIYAGSVVGTTGAGGLIDSLQPAGQTFLNHIFPQMTFTQEAGLGTLGLLLGVGLGFTGIFILSTRRDRNY